MGFNNTITIISNKYEFIEQISAKLVLLRELDKVTSCRLREAVDFLKRTIPNTIILHCLKNDEDAINLVKTIKADEVLKNIPILFLCDFCNRETLIDAFDVGINDIIRTPVKDYELLIRVIWCIQRNELNINIETRNDFIRQIGVLDSKNEIYTQEYCDKYIECQLNHAAKFKEAACLMLVTPDLKFDPTEGVDEFLEVIKKSIRLNDSIAQKSDEEFYIYLPKTKLNGAYSVYERINSNLEKFGASASVVEISSQKLDEVRELLESALQKAKTESNSLIVASKAYLPSVSDDFDETSFKDAKIHKISPKSETTIVSADETDVRIFRQTYKHKCKIVLEPVFQKYETKIGLKFKDVSVNWATGLEKTTFTIAKDGIVASLKILKAQQCKIRIDSILANGGNIVDMDSQTMEFVELNFQNLSQIVDKLYEGFIDCKLKNSESN